MQIQPYLFLDGRCEEALKFYGDAIGAKVEMLMRWKDCPDKGSAGSTPPDDKVDACQRSHRRFDDTGVGRKLLRATPSRRALRCR